MTNTERIQETFGNEGSSSRSERIARAFGGLDMSEWFTRMELDDPRRPIKVLWTSNNIPEESKRFLNHSVDRVRFPNGNEGFHHRVELPEGVMVGHINTMGQLALVMNYRHPLGRFSVELPSGGLEPEETARIDGAGIEERERIYKEAALREFREEVGVDVDPDDTYRLFGDMYNPGILRGAVSYANQSFHIFHAEGGEPVPQEHDDGEAGMLKVGRFGLDDAAEMIGFEIVDPATSTGVLKLNQEYGKHISRSARNADRHVANRARGGLRGV